MFIAVLFTIAKICNQPKGKKKKKRMDKEDVIHIKTCKQPKQEMDKDVVQKC